MLKVVLFGFPQISGSSSTSPRFLKHQLYGMSESAQSLKVMNLGLIFSWTRILLKQVSYWNLKLEGPVSRLFLKNPSLSTHWKSISKIQISPHIFPSLQIHLYVNISCIFTSPQKVPWFWTRSILQVDGAVGQKAAQPKKKAGENSRWQRREGRVAEWLFFFKCRFLAFFF